MEVSHEVDRIRPLPVNKLYSIRDTFVPRSCASSTGTLAEFQSKVFTTIAKVIAVQHCSFFRNLLPGKCLDSLLVSQNSTKVA